MPASLIALLLFAPQSFRLMPKDDIWVYPHASDPGHDANLRIWGASGHAVPADAGEAEEMSIALLKWDIGMVPAGKKLTKATLVLTNVPNPGFTLEQAKLAPLEARPVAAGFNEKSWEFDQALKFLPAKDSKDVFGTGVPSSLEKDKVLRLEIDLLKGPGSFEKYMAAAITASNKEVALGLTSAIDMASIGRTGMYKVYSRDEKDESLRPTLVLVFG